MNIRIEDVLHSNSGAVGEEIQPEATIIPTFDQSQLSENQPSSASTLEGRTRRSDEPHLSSRLLVDFVPSNHVPPAAGASFIIMSSTSVDSSYSRIISSHGGPGHSPALRSFDTRSPVPSAAEDTLNGNFSKSLSSSGLLALRKQISLHIIDQVLEILAEGQGN